MDSAAVLKTFLASHFTPADPSFWVYKSNQAVALDIIGTFKFVRVRIRDLFPDAHDHKLQNQKGMSTGIKKPSVEV